MPAKRSTRRTGSTPVSDRSKRMQLRDVSSPDTNSPALPEVPTKPSFAYGSSNVPLLPRDLAAKSKMNLTEMADAIDGGIQAAQERERESSKDPDDEDDELLTTQPRTRSSVSPTRRRLRRGQTPDQAQLLDGLRENSPVVSQPGRSTPTPPPPVPQTLSTTSSPPEKNLYPSPLDRFDRKRHGQSPLDSSPQANADNESIVSWSVERDIHDDHLQRTHSTRYRKTPQGKNISAPPRRPSGLAFSPGNNDEESDSESSSEPEQPLKRQVQSRPQSRRQPDFGKSTAPTRTIIPNAIRPETSSSRRLSPPLRRTEQQRNEPPIIEPQAIPQPSFSFRKLPAPRYVVAAIVAVAAALAVFTSGVSTSGLSRGLSSCFPLGKPYPNIPLNATGMDAVNALNNHVVKLSAQVSSLSKEMKFVRSEVDNVASSRVDIGHAVRKEVPKINFFSTSLGAIVDPNQSSPTAGRKLSKFDRIKLYVLRKSGVVNYQPRKPQPHLAALSPWEDVGDCWCSTPRDDDGVSQLSVLLGRDIVPEEVVVEHTPEGTSIDGSVAPREMELWAQFKIHDPDAPSESESASSSWSLPWSRSSIHNPTFPNGFSLSQYIMETIRLAYPNEPETEYSDDKLLGPDFFRVGKWTYDLHAPDHIQTFILDAIIDSPSIRVGKVVVRVKSNWGSGNTCLYRVKLHGHI